MINVSLVSTRKWSRLSAAMRHEILGALASTRGMILPAARSLGVSRGVIYRAIERFGITKEECLRARQNIEKTYIRFNEAESVIKKRLVEARKNNDTETAKLLSSIKADLKQKRVSQCASPNCIAWLRRGQKYCFIHDKEGRSLFKTNL